MVDLEAADVVIGLTEQHRIVLIDHHQPAVFAGPIGCMGIKPRWISANPGALSFKKTHRAASLSRRGVNAAPLIYNAI